MNINYTVSALKYSWQAQQSNGGIAGGKGEMDLEAITIATDNLPPGVTVSYRVYSSNIGWTPTVAAGGVAGTTGQDLQAEDIQIFLEGAPDNLGVLYQCCVSELGWLPFVQTGQSAGTQGQGYGIEAIKIVLGYVS